MDEKKIKIGEITVYEIFPQCGDFAIIIKSPDDNQEGVYLKNCVLKSENLSIQFAEWLSENEWIKRKHTHPNKVGQYYSHKHCEYKSIEELFEIYSGDA